MATATEKKQQTKKYVVLADALMVTIGKKQNGKPEYTRILRGGVINGNPESERIKDLLRAGTILLATSREHLTEVQADLKDPLRSRHRQTAKKAAAASGAHDDPVQAPEEDVLPLDAALPDTETVRAEGTDPSADE